jgi:hypothetical protein
VLHQKNKQCHTLWIPNGKRNVPGSTCSRNSWYVPL